MKIVLIGAIPPPAGGCASWAYDYLRYYRKKGKKIPLVNTSIIGERSKNVGKKINLFDEIRRSVYIWKSLIKTLRKFRPDIVHFNINCSPMGTLRDYICGLIVKKNKIPFVVHCHCNIEDQIKNSRFGRKILANLLTLADGIIVLNSRSMQFVKNTCKTKTVLIPNFISVESVINKKNISNKMNRVVYIGHIKKEKGIDEILKAAVNKPELKFLLAGPITEDYSNSMIKEVSSNVTFIGSVEHSEVIRFLDNADVFLFPSYTEGFSIALLEAMARGLPCIATDVGANADMLEKQGGIIIPVKDVDSIIRSLESLTNFSVREKMSVWNIEKVKKKYQIDAVLHCLERFYREVLHEQNK